MNSLIIRGIQKTLRCLWTSVHGSLLLGESLSIQNSFLKEEKKEQIANIST